MNKKPLIRNVLVPFIRGCDNDSAIRLACAITQPQYVTLVGCVNVPTGQTLSSGALIAQQMRIQMRNYFQAYPLLNKQKIIVSNHPWSELVDIITKESPDLVLLAWFVHHKYLGVSPVEVLQSTPCDIALLYGTLPKTVENVLVPIRGGPFAELALRISLSISSTSRARVTSLHLTTLNAKSGSEDAYIGLSEVLDQLPEINRYELITSDPADVILEKISGHELIIMGATAADKPLAAEIGPVARRIIRESQCASLIVKTARPFPRNFQSASIGSTAISVLVDKWFAENTFHANEFANLNDMVDQKKRQGLTISLALPALNEEKTVGKVIQTIKSSLMDSVPLLDEIVLMDSNSDDHTREIASSLGIPVYIHQNVLPEYGERKGKGEALWKSLYVTKGDILLWVDTDIVNIDPRFVFGLIGPLLSNPQALFVKGFYRRPLKVGDKIQAGGGGRVTELTARPLINLLFPELSGIVQPLSGEYGGRRSVLDKLPFFSGYGVEIGLLIDILEQYGLQAITQVDLLERIHHNQHLEALSKMSFAIIQAVVSKLERRFERNILEEVNKTMKFIRYKPGRFFLDIEEIIELERPPMIELPEYRQTHPS